MIWSVRLTWHKYKMMMLAPDILILILAKLRTLLKKFKAHNLLESQRLIKNPYASLQVNGSNQFSHHVNKIGIAILVISGDHQILAMILGKMRVKSLLLKDSKI
jgi:hypothetical protein